MKVLFINTVCGVGSTGTIMTDLMELLRQRGDTVRAVYGYGQAQRVRSGEAWRTVTPAGYYFHNALSRLTDHTGLYSAPETRALIRRIEEFDPDIVHLHNLHGYYLHYEILMRYLAESGRRVVWTLHDCWAFTGHCTHYTAVECRQWQTQCIDCPQLRQYPVCYLGGDVKGNYLRKKAAFTLPRDMVIATPSNWLAQQVKQSFLGKYPVRSVPNGVDTSVFCPAAGDFREKYGLTGKKILLGIAGTWGPRKGLDDFCALAEMLSEDYRIVLVGHVDRQLPERILALPRLSNPRELARIYSAADVFVNPTREDTYPTVNLEAQACGTPVVSYDVGGCAQTILPGFGRTVPCGDLSALAEAAMDWAGGKHLPSPGDAAGQLDKLACCGKYLELYDELCSGGCIT